VKIRTELRPEDRAPLAEILEAIGFFNAQELDVARELVEDRLARGQKSDYRFLVLEDEGVVLGYACWGPIPGTQSSAELYWIAVHPTRHGQGLGRALLDTTESWMARVGRTRVYLDTSMRPQYAPTRAFYLRCGYQIAAELPDFYAPGEGRATFLKLLPRVH
jgi:D-alanine-D-alanine ligase